MWLCHNSRVIELKEGGMGDEAYVLWANTFGGFWDLAPRRPCLYRGAKIGQYI